MSEDRTRDIQVFLRERVIPEGGTRHGLVVGIETYRDSRLNLRCACVDAKAVYDLMTDPDCGMFPKDNVRLLLDADATRDNIWRGLSHLRRNAAENDTVWIYYAGHGAPEESSTYWVTYDADVDDLYGTGLSNDQISRVLNDMRARNVTVFLDCCHAAATSVQKNPTRAALTAEQVFASYKGRGRITISSSDGKEKSVELGDVGHGAFTYFLEKGLRGEADADHDGVVCADELWRYLRGKVKEASAKAGNPQTPVLLGEMTHELPLTLNPIATERKKRIADAIKDLIGLGEDRLSTDEAEFCLKVLRGKPELREEQAVAAQFDALADGSLAPGAFMALVRLAAVKKPQPAARAAPTRYCPICGKVVLDGEVYYRCPKCRREHVCSDDYDPAKRSCVECESKAAVAQEKRQPKVEVGPATVAAEPEAGREAAATRTFAGIEFVWIPPGTFDMGSNYGDSDEKPVHRVTVRDFHIGKYEITNAQYKAFLDASGYDGTAEADSDYLKHFRGKSNMSTEDNHPIVWVSWKNAVAYCRWLSEQTGKRYRLPTEAEWEYACRAAAKTRYSFGDSESSLGDYAWHSSNSGSKTHEVGSKKPNAWGLYDMHGNVWEWCADWYDKNYYSKSPEVDPQGPTSGQSRVLRGGSWCDSPDSLRSANRNWGFPDYTDSYYGFRVARDP